ncbi:MAG: hypothetical protein K5912_02980 [Alphaproteobacteria bacterium]|nr:hypothetical protein [Alphaproteobacteria bacterium]
MKLFEKLKFWSKKSQNSNVCPGVDEYILNMNDIISQNPGMYKDWLETPFIAKYRNHEKLDFEARFRTFPNPSARNMLENYPQNAKKYGKEIAATVRVYNDKETGTPVLTVFPAGKFESKYKNIDDAFAHMTAAQVENFSKWRESFLVRK